MNVLIRPVEVPSTKLCSMKMSSMTLLKIFFKLGMDSHNLSNGGTHCVLDIIFRSNDLLKHHVVKNIPYTQI